ncbi:MAG: Hsp20/alpha crystallin family protein [Firmicutes bacterium]|nr:Hsp20/alpha crystallin family protein [Bacillota bacterium]
MQLVPWHPWRELQDMREFFDRVFGRRLREVAPVPAGTPWAPAVDVYDKDDKIVVAVELPGVDKKDVNILVGDDHVVVKGESRRQEEVRDKDYYRCERTYGAFARTIPLPVAVERENARATFKDGILEIVLPKAGGAKPKQLRIEIE